MGDNHGNVQNIDGDTVTVNVINDFEKITEAMNIALKRNNKQSEALEEKIKELQNLNNELKSENEKKENQLQLMQAEKEKVELNTEKETLTSCIEVLLSDTAAHG